jgi:exodeoxyribonuclease V alpha subunit
MILHTHQKLKLILSWMVALRVVLRPFTNESIRTAPSAQNESSHAGLTAFILKTLHQALAQGHTCLPLNDFLRSLKQASVTPEDAAISLDELHQQNVIHLTEDTVALPECAEAETFLAARLPRIGCGLRPIRPRLLKKWLRDKKLSEEQRAAIRLLTAAPVTILTGDPGTGKTSTVKALAEVFLQAGYEVHLTAPTGRAAARLGEATALPAQTLHRFLHCRELRAKTLSAFLKTSKEVIVVDESSMLDVWLAARLVRVCTARTRLIFVGDPQQLPPVGAGQILRDLLRSGVFPVAELTTCYRQSEQSRIIAAAQEIKDGRVPKFATPGEEKSDCYFLAAESPDEIQRLVINAVTSSLPARFEADPFRDIQVLTPMRNGARGTTQLNQKIRQALHASPSKENAPFCVQDRVLHIRNNYALGVFNGEGGNVLAIYSDEICVQYGAREVMYDQAALNDLTHGFAITIHRSQGSEYPFVVIPLHESQSQMLTRELLYTALTRGRQLVVLIGSRSALERAIANDRSSQRCTQLANLLAS